MNDVFAQLLKSRNFGLEKIIQDMRFYPSPIGDLPSVTSVLSATESPQAKARLANWKKNNPDNDTSPLKRGQFIDDLVSSVLRLPQKYRTLPSPNAVPDFVRPYVQCLITKIKTLDCTILEALGETIWVQGMVNDDIVDESKRVFYTREDNVSQEYVYSISQRYAGVPDFIGYWNDKLSLISLKTCNDLYASQPPDYKSANAYKKEHGKSSEEFSTQMSRHMRYQKAALQEVAYRRALQESLGIHVEQIVILVITALERPPQLFTLKNWAIDKAEQEWDKKIKRFWTEHTPIAT